MNRDKIYEKKARLYPVIIAMLLPLFLIIHLSSKMISTFNQLEEIWNIAISIIPASLITGALMYGVKSLSRSTSKALFQFPLFKENESKMPTTELILWKNKSISRQNKKLIHEKVQNDLGLVLMTEEQEEADEEEARHLIADAVKQIRERTRENTILFNYLCSYGFIRNFMGANVWALIIVFCLGVLNHFNELIGNGIIFGAIFIILLSYPVTIFLLKFNGKEYARQLYTAYLEL
jgi:hypothetical protein